MVEGLMKKEKVHVRGELHLLNKMVE